MTRVATAATSTTENGTGRSCRPPIPCSGITAHPPSGTAGHSA